MSMPSTLSFFVTLGVSVAAAALPARAVAQQPAGNAAGQSDTAQSDGVHFVRSGADTSGGEGGAPAGEGMVLPRSAVQQLMQQIVQGQTAARNKAKAPSRPGRNADSVGVVKASSDSTAADSNDD